MSRGPYRRAQARRSCLLVLSPDLYSSHRVKILDCSWRQTLRCILFNFLSETKRVCSETSFASSCSSWISSEGSSDFSGVVVLLFTWDEFTVGSLCYCGLTRVDLRKKSKQLRASPREETVTVATKNLYVCKKKQLFSILFLFSV